MSCNINDQYGIVEPGVYRCASLMPNGWPPHPHIKFKTILILSNNEISKAQTQSFIEKQINVIQLGNDSINGSGKAFHSVIQHNSTILSNSKGNMRQNSMISKQFQSTAGGLNSTTGQSITNSNHGQSSNIISQSPSMGAIQNVQNDIPLSCSNFPPSSRPIRDEVIKEGLQIVLDTDTHPLLICCTSGIYETCLLVGCLRKLQGWNFNSIIVEYRSWAGSKSKHAVEQFIELFDCDLVTVLDCPDKSVLDCP